MHVGFSKSSVFLENPTRVWHRSEESVKLSIKVPDIIDNAYVTVGFDNGCCGFCMFVKGRKNEDTR